MQARMLYTSGRLRVYELPWQVLWVQTGLVSSWSVPTQSRISSPGCCSYERGYGESIVWKLSFRLDPPDADWRGRLRDGTVAFPRGLPLGRERWAGCGW